MSPERIGDMDPKSKLSINCDASGDIVVTVYQFDEEGLEAASVEFCTISMGGGQSPRTFEALLELLKAIEEDNQKGRLAKTPTILESYTRKTPDASVHYSSKSSPPSEPE